MKGIFELDMAVEPTGNNLLLVDGLNLAFRYKHKRKRDFAADYVRTIESLAKSYNCNRVIVAADKGASEYRLEIYPEYKGNRKDKYATQTEDERLAFTEFLEDFEATMELVKIRFPLLRFKGVEADDIIAVLCNKADKFDNIWIISSDKDFDQLITDRVSRFSFITRKETTIHNFKERYDCTPEEYISLKVLEGDAGDNVPGVPGVGTKRGAALIKEYGSAFNIYDNLPIAGSAKYIQNVNNFGEQFLINYQLMDLSFSEEAVGEDNMKTVLEVLNNV